MTFNCFLHSYISFAACLGPSLSSHGFTSNSLRDWSTLRSTFPAGNAPNRRYECEHCRLATIWSTYTNEKVSLKTRLQPHFRFKPFPHIKQ